MPLRIALPSAEPYGDVVAIPTRNRSKTLAAAITAHQAWSGSTPIVAIDDGDDPEATRAHAPHVLTLDEREALAEECAARARIDVVHARAALLPRSRKTMCVGAARNGALLAAVERRILFVDDDVRPPLVEPEIEAAPVDEAADPTVVRFGARLRPSVHTPREILDGVDRERVPIAYGGIAGHLGLGSAASLLFAPSATREQLLAAPHTYEEVLASGRGVRAAPRDVLSRTTFGMAGIIAVDARVLLPPFLPCGRNQDGVFAAVVRLVHPSSASRFLPWCAMHEPPDPRPASREGVVRSAREWRIAEIVLALVRAASPLEAPTPADRLRRLAANLAPFLERDRFGAFVAEAWKRRCSALAGSLARLWQHERRRGAMAEDARALFDALGSAVREPPPSPIDAVGDDARAMIAEYRDVLAAWPELWRAASDAARVSER